MGGLSKKATLIESLRRKNNNLVLVVDSGNLLFKHPIITANDAQEKITARGIAKAYAKMGYDAVAVGPRDLSAGIDFLKSETMRHFPWISANLLDSNKAPVFHPWLIKKKDGIKIGFIGLTKALPTPLTRFHVADWQKILPPILHTLSSKCDHIILLSNLNNGENYRIAKQYPMIDIIISADARVGNLGPLLNNNSLITQAASRGKYMGNLAIWWGKSRKWDLNSTRSSSASTFSAHFIPLGSYLPDNKEMKRLVDGIKEEITTFHRKKSQLFLTGTPESRQKMKTTPSLIGYKRCEICHKKQTDFWRSTQHAQAYTSLKKDKQNNNPECLLCHVTHGEELFTKKPVDNSTLLALPPSLQTVGCEVCHGVGSSHAEHPYESKLILRPKQTVCLNCHTPARDSNFDFQKKSERIRCPPN